MQQTSNPGEDLAAEFERIQHQVGRARSAISSIIFGQSRVIDETLITLFSGGHLLLIGVPGLAKTKLVKTLGRVLSLDTKRIQFTPDVMPEDIFGFNLLEENETGGRSLRFVKGPVFCQLLMADEINRAPPRAQAALLESMAEHQVTRFGEQLALPRPFHVLATQNPLEYEGTFPLPEAQLDRFFMQVNIGHPERDAERMMLLATTGVSEPEPEPVMQVADLELAQTLVRRVPVGEATLDAILSLVRAGRPDDSSMADIRRHVEWGPGPRASQALMLAVRARALLEGRLAPSVEDVIALAPAVLRHRMALKFGARADGVTVEDIIGRLVEPLA